MNRSIFLKLKRYLRYFFFGLLLPFSFAPFHCSGLAIIGLALFYLNLVVKKTDHPFISGLFFGIGFFGLGVSWIYISIHDYGHLNIPLSALLTFMFVLYLALFPAITAFIFNKLYLNLKNSFLLSGLMFSCLWIISEYLRAYFLSGFPWLLIGFSQFDAPTKFFLPVVGVFGVGFITCFIATLLGNAFLEQGIRRTAYIIGFVSLLLSGLLFKNHHWVDESLQPISVGIIQANLSMRDKWDEKIFWTLLKRYQDETEKLLGTDLIVLPESAIPLPANYVSDFIAHLQKAANIAGSAILLGIPQPTTVSEVYYFNALISLGMAKGAYLKQHLVPFGEYIPQPFEKMSRWLGVPDANLKPGMKNQSLVKVHNHAIASLICYELAYGHLLREQLPQAEWIVSISDDGWFGHSFALYQQRQMAQVRSLETGRFQVVANNDGLSSIINTRGEIVSTLPAYNSGILKANLFPAKGSTPWVRWGDMPILLFCMVILIIYVILSWIKEKLS